MSCMGCFTLELEAEVSPLKEGSVIWRGIVDGGQESGGRRGRGRKCTGAETIGENTVAA